MADFAIRFNDFTGGDWGDTGIDKVKANQFHGINMTLYDSGLIGPRPGWKLFAQNQFSSSPPSIGVPPNTINNVGFNTVDGTKIALAFGRPGTWRTAHADWSGMASSETSPNIPVQPVGGVQFFEAGDTTLRVFMVVNGLLYYRTGTVSAPTWTAITTPAPLSFVVRWGLFLVGVDANVPWRIWFSLVDTNGPNHLTWPAENWMFVGATDPIVALKPIFNILYAGKVSGWWGISGVLGTLASVRELGLGNGPEDQRAAAVTTDNRVVHWNKQDTPGFWNGERTSLVEEQHTPRHPTNNFAGQYVIATPTERRVVMMLNKLGFGGFGTAYRSYKDGVWTYHEIADRVAAICPAEGYRAERVPPRVHFAQPLTQPSGGPWSLWYVAHDIDRPAFWNDTYASPEDQSNNVPAKLVTGYLELPAWFEGQGRQVRVRSVVIQFRRWRYSQLGDGVNRMTARVDSRGPYERGVTVGQIHEYKVVDAESSTDGTDDSWRFNVGEQGFGNGFQVVFEVIQGLAIREVIVTVDVRTERA